MFVVDAETKKITMHRGDTGSITFTVTGYDFSDVTCKALFTLKKVKGGDVVKEQAYTLGSNGQFTVSFANADTDYLTPGNYEYDVRLIVNPVMDGTKIVSGTVVRTPYDPIPVEIRRTVGEV